MSDNHLHNTEKLTAEYHFDRLGLSDEIRARFEEWLATEHPPTATTQTSTTPSTSESTTASDLARIVRVDRGLPLAVSARGTARVELSTALAREAKRNPLARVAVGDWVALAYPDGHENPIVEHILPRHGTFLRRDPAERSEAQVVIANVDIVFIVESLSGTGVNIGRLERELTLAFESGAKPIIVLAKADLIDEGLVAEQVAATQAVSAGAPVIVESAVTLLGVDKVANYLAPGVTAAMIGASGVGKSTLANRLLGRDLQETKATREGDDKGRHTTVAREMLEMPQGGVLIDTPGMRTIALWRADSGLDLAFPEIKAAAADCKFSDCRHEHEPKCAVRAGVEAGTIDEKRLSRYRKLNDELADVEQAWTSNNRRNKH